MQKEKQRKTRKKIIKKILFIIVILLILVFLVLLSIQFEIITFFKNLNKKPELFAIDDQCSLIMNRLIHNKIKSEGDCKINCNYECNLRKLKFSKIEFESSDKDCNTCNCYCL